MSKAKHKSRREGFFVFIITDCVFNDYDKRWDVGRNLVLCLYSNNVWAWVWKEKNIQGLWVSGDKILVCDDT